MKHKNRRQENVVGNTEGKGKENTTVKGQRRKEHGKKRIGSLLGTMKCDKELWKCYVVPCYEMD